MYMPREHFAAEKLSTGVPPLIPGSVGAKHVVSMTPLGKTDHLMHVLGQLLQLVDAPQPTSFRASTIVEEIHLVRMQ